MNILLTLFIFIVIFLLIIWFVLLILLLSILSTIFVNYFFTRFRFFFKLKWARYLQVNYDHSFLFFIFSFILGSKFCLSWSRSYYFFKNNMLQFTVSQLKSKLSKELVIETIDPFFDLYMEHEWELETLAEYIWYIDYLWFFKPFATTKEEREELEAQIDAYMKHIDESVKKFSLDFFYDKKFWYDSEDEEHFSVGSGQFVNILEKYDNSSIKDKGRKNIVDEYGVSLFDLAYLKRAIRYDLKPHKLAAGFSNVVKEVPSIKFNVLWQLHLDLPYETSLVSYFFTIVIFLFHFFTGYKFYGSSCKLEVPPMDIRKLFVQQYGDFFKNDLNFVADRKNFDDGFGKQFIDEDLRYVFDISSYSNDKTNPYSCFWRETDELPKTILDAQASDDIGFTKSELLSRLSYDSSMFNNSFDLRYSSFFSKLLYVFFQYVFIRFRMFVLLAISFFLFGFFLYFVEYLYFIFCGVFIFFFFLFLILGVLKYLWTASLEFFIASQIFFKLQSIFVTDVSTYVDYRQLYKNMFLEVYSTDEIAGRQMYKRFAWNESVYSNSLKLSAWNRLQKSVYSKAAFTQLNTDLNLLNNIGISDQDSPALLNHFSRKWINNGDFLLFDGKLNDVSLSDKQVYKMLELVKQQEVSEISTEYSLDFGLDFQNRQLLLKDSYLHDKLLNNFFLTTNATFGPTFIGDFLKLNLVDNLVLNKELNYKQFFDLTFDVFFINFSFKCLAFCNFLGCSLKFYEQVVVTDIAYINENGLLIYNKSVKNPTFYTNSFNKVMHKHVDNVTNLKEYTGVLNAMYEIPLSKKKLRKSKFNRKFKKL